MDLLSDFLARIRNGYTRRLPYIEVRKNNITVSSLTLLYRYGLITNFSILSDYSILVTLKYKNGQPALREVRRISKPGDRKYASCKNLRALRKRYLGLRTGMFILSTSLGVLSDTESLFRKVGGELLFVIC
jgi:small subunit ribosomal protein S8